MLTKKAFFSFTAITDPAVHREYNEWHHLDHRPENLALESVAWGERWVHSPDCAAVSSQPDSPLAPTQYINMYWLREPIERSIKEWQGLAEHAFQWGRRPDVAWTSRPLMGFFNVTKGYVARRVLVSEAVLPFRPNLGVYITVHQVLTPHSAASEALFRWYDTMHFPEAIGLDGVAGAYSFSSESSTLDPDWKPAAGSVTFDESSDSEVGGLRVHVYFLDRDPLEVAPRIEALDRAPEAGVVRRLWSGPCRVILPFQYDWFG